MPVGGAEPKGTYTPLPPASGVGFTPQSGTLLASLIISKNGQAKHVRVLQGISPQQDASTLKTLESWKFEPIARYNKPIEMEINVQVKFDLK
jgi:TonB family protein